MADNTVLLPGGGGDVIATDDVGGVKYERVKVNYGVDGSATDVSASNPLPVILTGTQAATPVTDNGGTISVDDGGGSITVDGTVSISGALDSELTTADLDTGAGTDTRAVVGLVRAESGGGTLVGSANPLPVSGTVTASGPLTDTQLRATPVPVSGTVTADTELPAAAALADATANPSLPSVAALGLLYNGSTWDRVRGDTTNGVDVDVTRLPSIPTGANTIGKVDQGAAAAQSAAWPTKLSNGTINADVLAAAPGSDSGQPAVAVRVISQLGAGSGLAGTIDAAADTKTNPASAQHTQSFNSVFNGTTWDRARGDITNGLDVDVTRLPALPAGTNNIGDVDVLTLPAIPAGANTIGKVDQGAPAVVANGWPVKLTDGTNNPAVKAASTAAAATDPALVVSLSPNSPSSAVAQGTPAAQANSWFTKPRKLATYQAVFRATARPYVLAPVIGANTRKQLATIHHAAVATKTVRLRRVQVLYIATSAASQISFDLVRLTATTAPVTGNPAITPTLADSSDAAAEATCLALPTTAGSEGALWGTAFTSVGITPVGVAANPPNFFQYYDLVQATPGDDEAKFPVIRSGVLEGWSVVADVQTAATINAIVQITFSEE